MTTLEAKDTLREKHLEMIESVDARMAGNSFEVRKWSVGLVTAVLGFSVDKSDWRLALLASAAAVVFWYLDSFYLYQERRFRVLFERVRHATVLQLEAHPYFLNPEYQAGAIAFPPSHGASIPSKESVFRVAFRDGLIQLHMLAIVLPLFVAHYLHK